MGIHEFHLVKRHLSKLPFPKDLLPAQFWTSFVSRQLRPHLGSPEGTHPDLCQFIPISRISSKLFCLLLSGRIRYAPTSSDLWRCVFKTETRVVYANPVVVPQSLQLFHREAGMCCWRCLCLRQASIAISMPFCDRRHCRLFLHAQTLSIMLTAS